TAVFSQSDVGRYIMKKITYIFIISILFSCGREKPYPNKISDFRTELQIHLKKLASEKKLPSSDTIARNYIKKNCTKEELLKLLKCENPIIRVIAYRTLVNKNDKDYFKVLLGHLNDTTKVTWWYYEDACDDFMVSDLLIRKAEDSRKLTQTEKKVLVDSVLMRHPYLKVSNWMLQDIEPNEKYYSIIKQRSNVKTDRCGEQLGACYALSKFKKTTDVKLLKNVFLNSDKDCVEWIFKSIENFPNNEFFPILQKYYEKSIVNKLSPDENVSDELLYFCRAIAAYKNKEGLKMLEYIEKNNTYINKPYWPPYNKRYVFKAINKFKSPIYSKLLDKIRPTLNNEEMKHIFEPEYDEIKTW
ncbi:hypothetical protein, partial [Flavobacterium branchiophilum]